MTVAHFDIPEADVASMCQRNGIRRLALFGSVLTDRFSESSDIDVLVSQLLGGRKIDLRTPMDLSRYFREEVLRDARVVYAES